MNSDDRRLEAFLRQFQPRQPAPLPQPGRTRHRWIPTGVAAAGVLAILTASLLMQRPDEPAGDSVAPGATPLQVLTIQGLSQQTAWDVDALDALLLDPTLLALPDVETPGGALRVLSRP